MAYTSYKNDPYWTTARFNSTCPGCKQAIKKGAKIFYFPKGKHAFCEKCGKLEHAKFKEAAEAEYELGGGQGPAGEY